MWGLREGEEEGEGKGEGEGKREGEGGKREGEGGERKRERERERERKREREREDYLHICPPSSPLPRTATTPLLSCVPRWPSGERGTVPLLLTLAPGGVALTAGDP